MSKINKFFTLLGLATLSFITYGQKPFIGEIKFKSQTNGSNNVDSFSIVFDTSVILQKIYIPDEENPSQSKEVHIISDFEAKKQTVIDIN